MPSFPIPSFTGEVLMANQQDVITLNRRGQTDRRETEQDQRQLDQGVTLERRATDRRKAERRRQIDPTTCERDYSQQEIEFMRAMDDYKRASGRMFPTCSEILEVIRGLGYRREDDSVTAGEHADLTDMAEHLYHVEAEDFHTAEHDEME
ncbi:MAG: hypothetical protein MK165_17415 [Pirellulaceae bacterium]|nr:hypothetical protein [Pirellulaceae bacterium]